MGMNKGSLDAWQDRKRDLLETCSEESDLCSSASHFLQLNRPNPASASWQDSLLNWDVPSLRMP